MERVHIHSELAKLDVEREWRGYWDAGEPLFGMGQAQATSHKVSIR